MPGDYSEELVELVRAAVVKALTRPGELPLGVTVLDALSSAGRLVPEGSEVREEFGQRLHWIDGYVQDWPTENREHAEHQVAFHQSQIGPNWRVTAAELVHRRVFTTPWTPAEPARPTIQDHAFEPYQWEKNRCGYVNGDDEMCGAALFEHEEKP